MFESSLGDLRLSTDPLSQNRYALAGGNPVSNVEIDGHMVAADGHRRWCPHHSLGHGALDVAGLVPVIGEPADLANAAWYEAEGDHVNAALSAASAVPLLGYGASAAKAAKYAKKGVDAVETAQDATTAARTASKFCSFGGRTRVVMANGSHKAISKVRVGDRVQARDPQTGQRVAKPVVALFVHPDVLVRLRIGKQVLTTTVDHRFWNSDEGRYQRADRLAKGDRVLGTDGRLLPVKGIRTASGRVGTAYNFEVADIHTYQVGPQGILVHNDCTPPTGSSASAAKTETSLVRYKEWPDNDGFFAGFEKDTVLQPGTRIDRYGSNRGSFVSPEGTPFRNRGLPSSRAGDPYSSFTVKKPITVRGGIAAPWTDSPGGGVQYLLPRSVQDLLNEGFLG